MPVEHMGSDFAALDYCFLYVKDLSDKDAASQIVQADDNAPMLNIWKLQDAEHMDLLEAAFEPA